MVFKRRDKRGTGRVIRDAVYPPGGWGRAVNYVYHRLRRLPDPPHRIARGIAAGMFISFTPLFGAHIPVAMLVAWMARGNVIAAMLATLIGNPLTFPLIAAVCLTTGHWIIGGEGHMGLHTVTHAFKMTGEELWWNLEALFGPREAHWDQTAFFWHEIFLPYALGGVIWGGLVASVCYMLANRAVDAYQRRRSRALQAKLQARLKSASHIVAE